MILMFYDDIKSKLLEAVFIKIQIVVDLINGFINFINSLMKQLIKCY